jgi:tRNA(Ile)-lysidine synthase
VSAPRGEPLERRIEASLDALLPGRPRVPLCVAFSGGLDSTVLLTALAQRAARPLRAIHIDHGLHPDSGEWAARCRAAAERLGVPLTVVPVSVERARGVSLEAAARAARYRALEPLIADGEALLTAQHADDQLETVLLQLLRGAGLPGLAAMPALAPFGRGSLVRPLLAIGRAEIESWARSRGILWIEDASNADERLDRNYLRRRIVPLLRERWPAASRAVGRAARHAAEAQRLLDALARVDTERAAVGHALCAKRLRALTPERRRNALRYWIARAGHPLPDARRLAELAGPVLEARPDAHPEVAWGEVRVRREADRLTLEPRAGAARGSRRESLRSVSVDWDAERTPRLELPAGLGRLELAADAHGPIDLDAVPRQLTIRARRGGERIRLRASGPSRALKTLLQEARVPASERERLPLVWSGERLLAAADLWVDAAIRADANSRRRGRLLWHRGAHFC